MLDFSSDHEKPTNAKIDCLKLHEPVKCSTFARAAALPPHALPWSGANGLSQPKDDTPRVPAAAKKKRARVIVSASSKIYFRTGAVARDRISVLGATKS